MFIQALVMHAWYISSSPCPQLSCKRLWQRPALIQLSALTYPLCTNLGNGRDFLCGLCFGHLNSWLYGALIFRFCCAWSHHCPHLQEINFWTGIIQHASSLRFTGLQTRKIAIVQEALSPFSQENPFRLPRVLYLPLYQLLTFPFSQNWMQLPL